MAKVSSLWVGGQLNLIQKISLASFVYYGHEVKLYVYDNNISVPNGVIKADANEIISENEVFFHHGKLATFSDYFRYIMIKKTGEMWVDADTICFTENFFDDKDTVFILEMKNPLIYAPGVLKLPQDSNLLNDLAQISFQFKDSITRDTNWGIIGPTLLTNMVCKHNLHEFAVDSDLINLVKHADATSFWHPKHAQEIIEKSKRAYCGTFFNSALDMQGFTGKNGIVQGSAIEYFYNKFYVDYQNS